jgi:hypothetical protein
LSIDALSNLRAPFPDGSVDKLPKGVDKDKPKAHCDICGGYHGPAQIHLDYVGHAAVTERLLDVDPAWSWEPVAWSEDGRPLLDLDDKGRPVGLWIRLTVAGVSRLGYGTVEAGKTEPTKELIGDAIRNAAMRFGVALELWKKHSDADAASVSTRGKQVSGAGGNGASTAATKAQVGKVHATCKDREVGDELLRAVVALKWPESEGHLSKITKGQASELIDFLTTAPDDRLDELAGRLMGGER